MLIRKGSREQKNTNSARREACIDVTAMDYSMSSTKVKYVCA
jgi:hypothetical protein